MLLIFHLESSSLTAPRMVIPLTDFWALPKVIVQIREIESQAERGGEEIWIGRRSGFMFCRG